MTSRRVLIGSLIGCTGLIVVGLLFVIALAIGTNIGLQKAKQKGSGDEGETTNMPKQERGEEYIPVVMRVSGEQGTRFRCQHSDTSSEGDPVQEEERGELGASPVEYRARLRVPEDRIMPLNYYGSCSIEPDPRGPQGRLKVELLVNDQVVDSGETRPDPPGQKSTRSSTVGVSYSPQTGGPDPAKEKAKK